MKIEQIYEPEIKRKAVRKILEALPDWFAIEESREQYIAESAEQICIGAIENAEYVGFLCLKETGKDTLELAVMGVLKEYHRRGIGTKMFMLAKDIAYEKGYSFLQVKTVQMGKYEDYDDTLLKFAVIISRSNGKWVLCKYKERDTYEVPGGHREDREEILETAKRELQEETGAIRFDIKPICIYSVIGKTNLNETGEESFGLLCSAEIMEFSGKLESEIEKVVLMDELPKKWTYPLIQPKLIEKYLQI